MAEYVPFPQEVHVDEPVAEKEPMKHADVAEEPRGQ
jgi:hypothetical protein